jgi:mannosyltransferase OCH1-like enzyme
MRPLNLPPPLSIAKSGAGTTITRMQSPTSTPLGGRLPKQIQRALPIYIACILFVVFLSNLDSFGSGSTDVLRRGLAHQKPIITGASFPRKIWQTWKVDPLGFEERDLSCARTWTAKNPGYRYEVLTDNNDVYYVETHFGPQGINRPDIVDMYKSLTAKIIKADLLRYLVMYVDGGVYADIDVEALRPLDRFVPERYNEGDIDMIIGVEIDQPEYKDHPILGQKSMSFCQWTFICKPRLPVMLRLVDNILSWLNSVAKKQGVSIGELVLDFDEVISGTGPSAFTEAILAEMSAKAGHPVDWSQFNRIAESKLVGGVLVLTVEAFAAGQGHSDSGNHDARAALVKHHYHASGWPTNHPRFNHPVYGEVEKCNWNKECVQKWDENTAAFEFLSPEEKATKIAEKEALDAAELAEKEAQEAREKAEREEREAKERAEREAREAKENAEREAREAKERAEKEAREAEERSKEAAKLQAPA